MYTELHMNGTHTAGIVSSWTIAHRFDHFRVRQAQTGCGWEQGREIGRNMRGRPCWHMNFQLCRRRISKANAPMLAEEARTERLMGW
jgi:hypothetical protein